VINLKQKAVIIDGKDNVATALADLRVGDILELEVGGHRKVIKLVAAVPFCHKLSISRIEAGSPIIKYGEVIGISSAPIEPGDYVHIHNIASTRGRGNLEEGAK
jgi:altronate dehydratase small subunit